VRALTAYRPYWAKRFGVSPFLPMSRAEMETRGWDECDIVIVTGDAYIDHPSFGMALIGRLLEAQGFRVGIISQPDWTSAADFRRLGQPRLFFGITAGNMDSMVNRYTAVPQRSAPTIAYTANAEPGQAARLLRSPFMPSGRGKHIRALPSSSAASRLPCAASRITTTGRIP